MKRRVPWFELCLLAGVALLGFAIWKSVNSKKGDVEEPTIMVADSPPAPPDPASIAPNYRYPGMMLARVPANWGGDSEWIAGMIDMELWKFVVKPVGTSYRYRMQLEVREQNKKSRTIATFSQISFSFDSGTQKLNLYIAILPLNGSLSTAAKIKCKIGTSAVSSSSVIDNPFRNHSSSGSPMFPTSTPPPDIPLWDVRFSDARKPARKLTLFLKIKPTTPAGP